MNRLLNILIHPFLLALILTLIIIYFLPDFFEKYILEVNDKSIQLPIPIPYIKAVEEYLQ